MTDRRRSNFSANGADPPGGPASQSEVDMSDTVIRPLTRGELSCAISLIKAKSAHGPDCVGSDFVKKLPSDLFYFLLKLFNKIFNSCKFPPLWKEYFVIFIPKIGSDKLRPISLSKIFFI